MIKINKVLVYGCIKMFQIIKKKIYIIQRYLEISQIKYKQFSFDVLIYLRLRMCSEKVASNLFDPTVCALVL